jgi:hypothetical protein
MCRRLTPQKAQQRMALLGQSSQPLSPSAGVFPRNDPDVAGESLAVAKPFWIAQENKVGKFEVVSTMLPDHDSYIDVGKLLYAQVLHRPFEPAAFIRTWDGPE